MPQSEHERGDAATSEWQGRLAAMKSAFKSEIMEHGGTIDAKIGALDAKIGALDAKIGENNAKIGENNAKINQKMDELLSALSAIGG